MTRHPAPADLEALRSQLGNAIVDARLAAARAHEEIVRRVLEAVRSGEPAAAAARRVAPHVSPSTIERWIQRWKLHGLAGLVSRRAGAPPDRVRSRRPVPQPEQLSLVTPFEAAARPHPARRLGSRGKRARGLLKMPGAKWAVVDRLVGLAPARFTTYHEPFLGTGALFYALRPPAAVLSDANTEFVNLYEVVRDAPAKLLAALQGYANTRAEYLRVRGIRPGALPPVERAARTMFLNRTAFNGLFRVNAAGLFNVPYGSMDHSTFFQPQVVWAWHRALAGATLIAADFAGAADRAQAGDLVFLDPPYARGLRSDWRFDYQAGGFGDADHRRVADLMRRLDRRGCRLMVTNSDCDFVRDLYRGFRLERVRVPRHVGGRGTRRGVAAEIVACNYDRREARMPEMLADAS